MLGRNIGILILVGAVLLTAVGVVYAKHRSRTLFVEVQALQGERDEMNIEWGRLQLEQSTWAANGRVDNVARERLGMFTPPVRDIVVVNP